MYIQKNTENRLLLNIRFDYRKRWEDLIRFDRSRFERLTELSGEKARDKWNELRAIRFQEIDKVCREVNLEKDFNSFTPSIKSYFMRRLNLTKDRSVAEMYRQSFKI